MSTAGHLAAVLDQWVAGADPGERSPHTRMAALDADGGVLTSHELTQRQAAELAALVADSDPEAPPGPLGAELHRFAGPADTTAVRLVIDEPAAVLDVAFTAPAAGHLCELLEYGLAQRATAARLIAVQSPLRAGQRVQLRSGEPGTIAFVTVTWPHEPAGQAALWFHVRLDTADEDLPRAVPLSALAPLA